MTYSQILQYLEKDRPNLFSPIAFVTGTYLVTMFKEIYFYFLAVVSGFKHKIK